MGEMRSSLRDEASPVTRDRKLMILQATGMRLAHEKSPGQDSNRSCLQLRPFLLNHVILFLW